jgi:hypothetical protein
MKVKVGFALKDATLQMQCCCENLPTNFDFLCDACNRKVVAVSIELNAEKIRHTKINLTKTGNMSAIQEQRNCFQMHRLTMFKLN